MEEETESDAGGGYARVARSHVFNHFARSQWHGTGQWIVRREAQGKMERWRTVSRNVSCCFRPTRAHALFLSNPEPAHVSSLSLSFSLFITLPLYELYLSGWMLEFLCFLIKPPRCLCASHFFLSFTSHLLPVRLIVVFVKRFKAMFSDGVFCASEGPSAEYCEGGLFFDAYSVLFFPSLFYCFLFSSCFRLFRWPCCFMLVA